MKVFDFELSLFVFMAIGLILTFGLIRLFKIKFPNLKGYRVLIKTNKPIQILIAIAVVLVGFLVLLQPLSSNYEKVHQVIAPILAVTLLISLYLYGLKLLVFLPFLICIYIPMYAGSTTVGLKLMFFNILAVCFITANVLSYAFLRHQK